MKTVIAIAILLFGSVCMADTLSLGAPGPIAAGTVLSLPVQLNMPVQGTDEIAVNFAGASFTSAAPVDVGLIMYTTGDPCGGFPSGWGTLSGQAPLRLGVGCGYTILSDGSKVDPWMAVGLVGTDASAGVTGMTFDIAFPSELGVSITSADFLVGFSGNGAIVAADPPAPVSTPEPLSLSLLMCGAAALLLRRKGAIA